MIDDETNEILDELFRVERGGGTYREARRGAGLSVGAVEKLTGIPRERIRAGESGLVELDHQERRALRELYEVQGFSEPPPSGRDDSVAMVRCAYCRALYIPDGTAAPSERIRAGERHTPQCGMLKEIAQRGSRRGGFA